jgi:hypothetical protein
MLKKDSIGSASKLALAEAFRCQDCLHFKNHPHSAKEQICEKEGVKAIAIAPSCFTPNLALLVGNSDQFVQLAALFNSYDAKQKRTLLAVLRQKPRGHKLGTKLFFCLGKEFVSNFLAGYVAGYSSTGELILIGSPDNKTRGSSFITYMTNDDGLLTMTDWKVKRAALVAANKIYDPSNRIIKKASVADDYVPPTIDVHPEMLEAAPPRKRVVMDVVDQISSIPV